MSGLQMISRGGEYRGKVYFCCHPAEQALFLQPISQEILQKQNCAVWYLPEGMTRDEAFYEDLKEMQLFVMPVTRRFLTGEHAGLEDFRFAVAHHIPVLPLLQEPGLEALFNRVCGDLQCLGRFSNDGTAIDYDTKVTRFLESVLIGDELAQNIRKAFDAYVFLSYRKKDRRYAQELMRLIHKDPRYRDIAIWYDEFLVPGEDFNDAIRQQIDSSDLFALAVTPNLVNEENYVMKEEYPLARELGKKVLPAQMQQTSMDALRQHYAGIQEPIDPRDEERLSAAMVEALGKLADGTNDNSPEHRFLIGLAYLSGVDVEVDTARGAELILASANAGYLPAMHKLEHMYRNGQGVERNMNQVLHWQWQRIRLLLQAVTDGLLELNRRELEQDFSEIMYPGRSREDMEVRYERHRALKFYKQQLNTKVDAWLSALNEMVYGVLEIGNPERLLDKVQPAIRFLEKYGDPRMYTLTDGHQILSMGAMENSVLDLYAAEIALLQKAKQYQQVERRLQNLQEKFGNSDAGSWQNRAFGVTVHKIRTEMLLDKGDYAAAEESRKAWVAALVAVTGQIPGPAQVEETNADFSVLMNNLLQMQQLQEAGKKSGQLCAEYGKVAAPLFLAMGRIAEAEDAYDEIPKGLQTAGITDEVAVTRAYLRMAGLGLEKAPQYLEEAKRRLLDLPRTDLVYLPLHRDLALVEGNLAEAWALALELARDVPTAENLEVLGTICEKLGQTASQDEKNAYVQQLLAMMDRCTALKRLHNAEALGNLYEILGNITGEAAYWEKARNVFAQLVQKYPQNLRYQAKRDALK